ncbi:hypothetical protein HA466_0293470 [Hirschfeldia incana]|nr:hypothetical protein HA466_0293470 [Hirschfeldia incana]
MFHLAGVLGEWKLNNESWKFVVNTRAGSRLLLIKEGLKFDEMVQMVHEDFGINRSGNELEFSYALPESMLGDMPEDTPPVFVNNDRQWDTLCEMCKSLPVRLCISLKNLANHDQGFNGEDTATVNPEEPAVVKRKNVNREDSNQEPEVEDSNFHDAKVIEKGQWFKNKAELSWSIQMLSIERKFRTSVSKSDKKLLVVKCADTSYKWKVRAAKTNPTSEFFWVTKYIDKHTCFSRNIGGPRASSKVINIVLIQNIGRYGKLGKRLGQRY